MSKERTKKMFFMCEILEFLEYEGGYTIGMRKIKQRMKADDVPSAIEKAKEEVKKFNDLKRWVMWGLGGHAEKAFYNRLLTDITRCGQNVFRSYTWP